MNNFLTSLFNNPNQMLNQMINNNPNSKNIMDIANQMTAGKSQDEIKNIVKNLCREKNIDFSEIEKMVNERK